MAEGITPLEVELKVMRLYVARAEQDDVENGAGFVSPYWDKAAIYAEMAAPFIHPRLAAVAHSGNTTLTLEMLVRQSYEIVGEVIEANPNGQQDSSNLICQA